VSFASLGATGGYGSSQLHQSINILSLDLKFHLHKPLAINSHRTLHLLFISTIIVVVTLLVTKKNLLHLCTLPALAHIKSGHFGIVAVVIISISELIKFHVLLRDEPFEHQWTLSQYQKKINMTSSFIWNQTTQ
jgi:hypothetical protein